MIMSGLQGKRIHINGIVQGVGFRPFVFGLAEQHALRGWVRNTSAGVDIEVDGTPDVLEKFVVALSAEAPPLAQIDEITAVSIPPNHFTPLKSFTPPPSVAHSSPFPPT